jgi:hypothetical protein
VPLAAAEWWVHSRVAGRNLGHQLHFDTDETLVERSGAVRCPAISSVVYLAGEAVAAGPTVVFEQGFEAAADLAKRCWLVRPADSGPYHTA